MKVALHIKLSRATFTYDALVVRDQNDWGTALTDPAVLRALAHPARLRMLDLLTEGDGATATECAQVVGLSPSSCSWHLRQLHAAGLVRLAGPSGDARQRRWAATTPRWQVALEDIDADPTEAQALDVTVTQALLHASDATVEAFTIAAAQGAETPEWRVASLVSNSVLRVTSDELDDLTETVRQLLAPYRRDARATPDGARTVHAALRFVPAAPNNTDDHPELTAGEKSSP